MLRPESTNSLVLACGCQVLAQAIYQLHEMLVHLSFIGFAVGRTTFWDAVADYVARKATRQEAASRIAQRYRQWTEIFERAHWSRTELLGVPVLPPEPGLGSTGEVTA